MNEEQEASDTEKVAEKADKGIVQVQICIPKSLCITYLHSF